MEISSKELREVEFRERLRGYDTTEVDEFLERVAVAVDALHTRVREQTERAERAEQSVPAAPPVQRASEEEDTLRRTLVLAQRTADMAVREAQEEAGRILDRARADAEAMLERASDGARRMAAEAERGVQAEVEQLTAQRDQLRVDARTLSDLLDNERERLSDALSSALRWVEQSFASSPHLATHRAAPLSTEGVDAGDGVESQIEEDAEAARHEEEDTHGPAEPDEEAEDGQAVAEMPETDEDDEGAARRNDRAGSFDDPNRLDQDLGGGGALGDLGDLGGIGRPFEDLGALVDEGDELDEPEPFGDDAGRPGGSALAHLRHAPARSEPPRRAEPPPSGRSREEPRNVRLWRPEDPTIDPSRLA